MAMADEKEGGVFPDKEIRQSLPPAAKKNKADTKKESRAKKTKEPQPAEKSGTGPGRKKLKTLKQVFEFLLASPLGEEMAALAGRESAGLCREMTVYEAIAAVQVAKAMKGDARAFELIRNTLNEKQAEKSRSGGQFPKVMIVRGDGSVREI